MSTPRIRVIGDESIASDACSLTATRGESPPEPVAIDHCTGSAAHLRENVAGASITLTDREFGALDAQGREAWRAQAN